MRGTVEHELARKLGPELREGKGSEMAWWPLIVALVVLLGVGVPIVGVEPACAAELAEAEVAYTLGLDALARGEAAEARRQLEAALRRAPRDAPWRARAEALLAKLAAPGTEPAEPLPPALAGEILLLDEVPRYEGRLGLALGRDSNPGLVPDETPSTAPDGSLLLEPQSDEIGDLDLRWAGYPVRGGNGWTFGIALSGRAQLHGDLDVFDAARARAVVSLARGGDPLGYLSGPLGVTRVPAGWGRWAFTLQAAFTHDELDGERWGRAVEGAAALWLREGSRGATQLEFALREEDAFGPREQASGSRQSIGVSQYLYCRKRNGFLRVGARAEERDAGAAFDSSTLELAAELALPLSGDWSLFLAAARAREEFDELASHPFFTLIPFLADQPREDTRLRLGVLLTRRLGSRWLLSLRAQGIERDTELGTADAVLDLDADQTQVLLGATWLFGGRAPGGGSR